MNKQIEVEGSELGLKNSNGDIVIIPKNKAAWVKGKLKDGCHGCIDAFVSTLPTMRDYAKDGTLIPDKDKKPYDYIYETKEEGPEAIITPTQAAKDRIELEKEFTVDNYIDGYMPAMSRFLGVEANNINPVNKQAYDKIINDRLAERVLARKPKTGDDAASRLAWYNSMDDEEREILSTSSSSSQFEPAARAYRENQSDLAKNYTAAEMAADPTKMAQSVEGTAERFRLFPNAENSIEDYVNPGVFVGDLAKNLGNTPKDVSEGNYGKAAMNVVAPLAVGAIGGIGAKTTKQFVKNITLPLGGAEIDVLKEGRKRLLNKGEELLTGGKKYTMEDFNKQEEFYRVVVGDDAYDDIVNTQSVRVKNPADKKAKSDGVINLDRRGTTSFPSFSKGEVSIQYAKDNPNHYVIVTGDGSIKPSTSGRHGKNSTMFPTGEDGKHLTSLSSDKVKVYKHIGNGEYQLQDLKPKKKTKKAKK